MSALQKLPANDNAERALLGAVDVTRHPKQGPQIVRASEPEIDWSDYPHIEPGEYRAISTRARTYWDRRFQRWVCMVQFQILNSWGIDVIAKLPLFLNLGSNKDGPRAGRCSAFWQTWVRANGSQPRRPGRLTARVFQHRAALVEVADTAKSIATETAGRKTTYRQVAAEQPYSIVRRVIHWQTGVSKSVSQQVKAGLSEGPED